MNNEGFLDERGKDLVSNKKNDNMIESSLLPTRNRLTSTQEDNDQIV